MRNSRLEAIKIQSFIYNEKLVINMEYFEYGIDVLVVPFPGQCQPNGSYVVRMS
jgi:hypothetical protein